LVVRWAEEAAENLATIFHYIDQRNPAAARRLHDDIVITAENLGERPFL
jgi:plasmid stabilization system protein ParE